MADEQTSEGGWGDLSQGAVRRVESGSGAIGTSRPTVEREEGRVTCPQGAVRKVESGNGAIGTSRPTVEWEKR